jgi:phosphoenolpyruvate carboxykinase (ATP)
VVLGQGVLTDSGAIAIETGEFTGRSPQDRFIVCDNKTENAVWWGDINKKFETEKYNALYNRMKAYLTNKDLYVRDAYACADDEHRLNLRVVTEFPWSNMFAYNMFLRPTEAEKNGMLYVHLNLWLTLKLMELDSITLQSSTLQTK